MRDKRAKDTVKALKAIYERKKEHKILELPDRMEVDHGGEFKGEFKQYMDDKEIFVRYAEPQRSRQQAVVESRNGTVARALMRRMLAEEMLTDKQDTKWVNYLEPTVRFLNERLVNRDPHKELEPEDVRDKAVKKADAKTSVPPKYKKLDKYSAELLNIGDRVRYLLDKPKNYTTEKRESGTFWERDIRWSKKVSDIEDVMLIVRGAL